MRLVVAAAAVLLASSSPAFAQTVCPLQHAVYVDPENGFELQFRPGKPWEYIGMTDAIMELVTPGGDRLWGSIASNMGTSRDVGRLYFGCPSPSAEGPGLTDEEEAGCLQWEGVVYSLNDGEPGFVPNEDEPAPERLLLSDFGRQIRYSDVVDGPGEEPWDVLDFKRCTR